MPSDQHWCVRHVHLGARLHPGSTLRLPHSPGGRQVPRWLPCESVSNQDVRHPAEAVYRVYILYIFHHAYVYVNLYVRVYHSKDVHT